MPFHIPESFLPMECAVKKLFLNTKVCRFIFSREAINFRPPIHGGTRVLTHNQLNVQRCYFNKRRTCSVYIYTWNEGSPPPSVPSTLEQEVYREYLPEMVAGGVGLSR